jgi:hypothetical protein
MIIISLREKLLEMISITGIIFSVNPKIGGQLQHTMP